MIDIIKYYYKLKPTKLEETNDSYHFSCSNDKFLLYRIYQKEEITNIIKILNNSNVPYHLLIMNKDNNLYTVIDNKLYVLMKIRYDNSYKPPIKIACDGYTNWEVLWSKRVDYYEKQISELIIPDFIKYATQYYIGITEIAIELYQNSNNEKDKKYMVMHKIINYPIDFMEYYNPFNMLIDQNVRDLAETIKQGFFNEYLSIEEILNNIQNKKYDKITLIFLYIRLLYPSYYFYEYDKIIEGAKDYNKIIKIIKNSKNYEFLLSEIYQKFML